MKEIGKIGILGGGSWATALAKIVLGTQPEINWYVRREAQVAGFQEEGRNPTYLSSVPFDVSRIQFFSDRSINQFFKACDTVLLVTPSPYVKSYLNKVSRSAIRDKFVVNAIKGIVPDDNLLVSEFLQKEFNHPTELTGVVAGPCHAEEVARSRNSYLTVGCASLPQAEAFAAVLRNHYIMATTSTDVVGIEYASVLKNVYAIMAGICNGLGLGDNFQSVLMSNAIAEMNSFVDTVHLIARTITDSVYLGDLLVTAYSQYSRNRTFGNMVGRGYSVKAAQVEMSMIAEGYYGVKCIREVNTERYRVNMPITDAVYDILYGKKDPKTVITDLAKNFK